MKLQLSKKQWIMITLVAFMIGLGTSLVLYNQHMRSVDQHVEITFIDPHQAVIFWTTAHDSIGFVRYGSTAKSRTQLAYQTSGTPGVIHAALLTDVPTGGLYYSLHTDADSPMLWPKIEHLIFDPTTIE